MCFRRRYCKVNTTEVNEKYCKGKNKRNGFGYRLSKTDWVSKHGNSVGLLPMGFRRRYFKVNTTEINGKYCKGKDKGNGRIILNQQK